MSVEEQLEAGVRAHEQGDLSAAQQFFKKAIALQETAEGWSLLADVQVEAGAFAKAHKSITAGLKIEVDNIDLLFTLGDLHLEEENNDKAIESYQQIIALDAEDVDARVSKAVAQMNSGDLTAAESTCREALEIDPNAGFAYNALGDICISNNKNDLAMDCFKKSLAIDASDPQPYLSLAELYYEAHDLEQAEEFCKLGLALEPGLPLGYLTLGYICLDQERTQEAIDNFQQFLNLETSSAAKYVRDEVAAVIDGLK